MKKTILVALLMLLTQHVALAQNFRIESLSESTVKLTIKSNNATRSASGFLWKHPDSIITSFHAVAGSTDIIAECRGQKKRASISRLYRDADLALLKAESFHCQPLSRLKNTQPSFNDQLFTFGFYGGATNGISRTLRRGFTSGSETLKGLLPPSARAKIEAAGAPDLNLGIYYLNGSLLPGFSGAPIVDGSGELVGIGDGGLENGAAQISWIIPARYIDDLLESTETAHGVSDSADVLFSSEVDVPDEKIFEFESHGSTFRFIKTKTRSLAEMAKTSEDPDGITRLLDDYRHVVNDDAFGAMEFDVYEEIDHGIILTVPAGQALVINKLDDTVAYLTSETRTQDGDWLASFQY